MYRFEDNMRRKGIRPKGFSLLEVVVALGVLAVICSAVLVVMNRCIAATIDSQMKVEAFEVVRRNMEKLLGAESVTLTSELGTSDTNPNIQWQTVVETFNEPVGSGLWLQAVCSASYTDSAGEKQTIELVHWLTDLSRKDQQLIQKQRETDLEYLEQFGLDELGVERTEQPVLQDALPDESDRFDAGRPEVPAGYDQERVDKYDLGTAGGIRSRRAR